ncbi:hypothetical protein [Legionella erythra]|uniref:Coiled-coil protein n=1 Tax=Legionella erythra TaxID=448 RepID=A0A0W0TRW5_LEGER|nr:hypothetical protein [Legionella erythra]KTC98232.1 coiled-coil protein [Legionella erythra]
MLFALVKKNLLGTIHEKLVEKWLKEKDDEIRKKTQLEVVSREKENLRLEANKGDKTKKIAAQANPPETREMHGYHVYTGYIHEFSVSEYVVIREIKKTYTDTFNQLMWERGLDKLFSDAIDALQPETAEKQLLTRHPWIKRKDMEYSSSIPYQFLYSYLEQRLLATLQPNALVSWSSAKLSDIEEKAFKWGPFSETWLNNYIENYPFLNVRGLYIDATRFEYLTHYTLSTFPSDGLTRLNMAPSRIDVFRYLFNLSYMSMQARERDGLAITANAPVHWGELELLKPAQWAELQNILVNINSEEAPVWALIKRTNTGWTAYLPPFGDESQKKSLLAVTALKGLVFEEVNCKNNINLNDLGELHEVARWHAVLFGRIVPWSIQNSHQPLAEFRDKVPLPVLHQSVLEHCLSGVGGKSSNAEELKKAARNRKPFSDLSWTELNPRNTKKQLSYLLDQEGALDTLEVSDVLDGFDKKELQFSPDLSTLTVKTDSYLNVDRRLTQALHMVYLHAPARLVLPSTRFNATNKNLVDYDNNLRTVKPLDKFQFDKANFSFLMHCAARNRFLAEVNPGIMLPGKITIAARKRLWKEAGNAMVAFFQKHGESLDLDFINEAKAFDKHWRGQDCDHEHREGIPATQWSFAQIAQMGQEGLDELFTVLKAYSGDPDRRDPSPNLPCTFDLNGSLTDEPHQYIAYLSEKIQSYYPKSEGHTPLFKRLSLILPDNLDENTEQALIKLITVLDERKKRFPQELSEVNLYNLKNYSKASESLIQAFANRARYSDLKIQINIPAWNRDVYTATEQQRLKASYRDLQNIIQNNQRRVRHEKLELNTRSIYLGAAKKLDPQLILDSKLEQEHQSFDGEDVLYPLTAQTPGIQQQLQQEVAQEFKLGQEDKLQQEQEQEQEQEQQIMQFYGDESQLITRDNIDEKCRDNWQGLPDQIKHLSGWEKQKLSQLFSLWVGSHENAPLVIEKIHPDAMQKIMAHAPQFRMGIAKDNLPAGFFLQYSSKGKGLILCFDELRERKELRAQKFKELKLRNPFTLELYTPRSAAEFKGDYRQFTPFSQSKTAKQTFWQYLATEDSDKIRLHNAARLVDNSHLKAASVILQHVDIQGEFSIPDDYSACLSYLRQWVQSSEIKISDELALALFNEKRATVLTEKNLRAFGQVFDHYDVLNGKSTNGSEHFLFIADQILKHFGEQGFRIWKSRFLDVSENWSEYLEKSEVDAIALSIVTLKDFPRHQALWWKLVDAHGQAVGHLRYADLWYAFQKVLKYVEERNLTFDEQSFNRLLESTPNFNARVFLDRLYTVLKEQRNQFDSAHLQQLTLNHLDQIDWRHNGFYYASRYQQFPYWDKGMAFSEFHSAREDRKPGYPVDWDSKLQLKHPTLHALRFASKRMQLSQKQFLVLKGVLDEKLTVEYSPAIRLLMASISLGVDHLEDMEREKMNRLLEELTHVSPDLLQWMNEAVFLEQELLPGLLRMRYEDIPVFSKIVGPAYQSVKGNPLDFINASGRALHCLARIGNQGVLFQHLIDHVHLSGFNKPLPLLFTTYPWLITESMKPTWQNPADEAYKIAKSSETFKQLQAFEKQLQSIDFDHNTYWPDALELQGLFKGIAESPQPAHARREAVSYLLKKQCAITFQDAPFRALESKEIDKAYGYLDTYLKPGFKNHNLHLAGCFLKEYAAIKADTDAEKQIERFLKLIIRLDNKAYFDEVGQVLGTLISRPGHSKKRYSLPQLTSWLESLMDDKVPEHHYPINLLTVILDNALTNDLSLINSDLNQLKETDKNILVQQASIRGMVQEPLPNQYKPVLVELLLIHCDRLFVRHAQDALGRLHALKVSGEWLKAVTEFLAQCKHSHLIPYRQELLSNFAEPAGKLDAGLVGLWQETQVKLIDLFVNKGMKPESVHAFFSHDTTKQVYIKIILLQALTDWDKEKSLVAEVKEKLARFPEQQLSQLAQYYGSDPRPSLAMLSTLLGKLQLNTAEKVIHHFESVEQGLNDKGLPKRHYSLRDDDRSGLMRVLAGFKRKGQAYFEDAQQKELINLLYYANNFSQIAFLDQLQAKDLTAALSLALGQLKTAPSAMEKHEASARVLACMREILLRKSGKWANHTQMLSLLYAALYNDESLLHQVRTGQGKSIITVMRSAYLALNDYVVDVFSSKDSLSKRDHDEFAPVLDAMGIRHAYITESSDADTYQTRSAPGIGAINYATIGNFSLFQSGHIWKGEHAIELDPKRRAAWLDEADYILRFEQTQFNYSDNAESDPIYNMDEWVYRATYDWYLENQSTFHNLKENGIVAVSRKEHLESLCKYLQERKRPCSPKQSHFFENYLAPALTKNEAALKKRDRQLKQLLTAAHIAISLKEGTEFCIRPDSRRVAGGLVINTRSAKVVISNQIRHGSTYSDLVQQFLHIRLNKEAIRRGETPDFFVEPETQIALSQNAPYLLKKYYSKLEGCTGTAGNAAALHHYREEYGIEHVSKLPTHEAIRTTYLPMIFCSSEAEQVGVISDLMVEYQDQPILHACQDDPTVKRLSQQIGKTLGKKNRDMSRFLVDTNDSGKQESDILPGAGFKGAISNSARLGRGTDIKPQSEKGLVVIRSYPADPDIEKQERGRQGRNGAKGVCIDVIDYSKIESQYNAYHRSIHKDRLEAIVLRQQEHIHHRLEKHKHNGSSKWNWLNEAQIQKKYIITRSVVQLNLELKHEREKFLRRKEYLIATLSGEVMDALHDAIRDKDNHAHKRLSTAWLEHRRQIEDAWNSRLAGKQGDNEEVYGEFFKQADAIWQGLCALCPQLNALSLLPLAGKTADMNQGARGVLKYLEEQVVIWKGKLESGKLHPNDKPTLMKLKKQLKSLVIEWHPDRLSGSDKSAEDKELGPDMIRVITQLIELRSDCENKLDGKGSENEQNASEGPQEEIRGNGNMVIYKPGYRHIPKNQKRDMANVVSFYQSWVDQTERHYIQSIASPAERREVINAAYGATQVQMNRFYQELDSLSHAEQTGEARRASLFMKLTACINQHKAAFSVSCGAWADVIELLRNQPDNKRDDSLFDALNTFFAQSWINKKDPIRLNAEKINNNSALLTLVMKISATAYVTENDASRTFIRNFSEVIRNDFWRTFVLIPEIEEVFASKPNVTRLLSVHTNQNDLGYLLGLIAENHERGLHGDAAAQKSKGKIKALLAYLDENTNALMKNPALLRPLVAILLSNIDYDYLPKADILSNLNPEAQGRFWYFLSQRLPLQKKSCDQLVRRLASFEQTHEFNQKVLEPLCKLPSYLSLDYINEQLQFRPGRYQLDDCQAVLLAIHDAGKVFNEFLRNRKIIESSTTLSTPCDSEAFLQWMNCFTRMPAARARDLFKAIKKSNVPPEELVDLAGRFTLDKSMSLILFECYLTILESLEKVKAHKEKFAFLKKEYEHQFNLPNLERTKAFGAFVEWMVDAPAELTTKETTALWGLWEKDHDRALMKESLDLMTELKRFDQRYPEIKLMEDYLGSTKDKQANEFYRDFLDVVNSNQNKGVDKEGESDLPIMHSLVQAYFKTKVIRNKSELNEAFRVVSEAKSLNKSQRWADYFGDIGCKKQQDRRLIMQYLHHGLLDLGEKFSSRCYKEYNYLAQRVIPVAPEKLGNDRQGRSQLRQCFSHLIQFTQELVEITKAPFIKVAAVNNSHLAHEGFIKQQKAYFGSQQAKYASFWLTTNSIRKNQARDLFIGLNDLKLNTREAFYEESLKTIWGSQREILKSDIGTKHNKKGYSRLYDISVQMFLKIARDMIADTDVAAESKVFLNDILNKQTRHHVDILYARLPDNHPLKGPMGALMNHNAGDLLAWTPGSVELTQLKTLLEYHADNIPDPLKYLTNNLVCLMEVPITETREITHDRVS